MDFVGDATGEENEQINALRSANREIKIVSF